MKIAIGSDHGGFALKETVRALLQDGGHEVVDCGCYTVESVDYPDFADEVCGQVLSGDVECGILVCGTGIGMSMAANRHKGIRAALCHDEYTARLSREHNDANILCLGDRVLRSGVAAGIVDEWMSSAFAGGRHLKRIGKFSS